MRKRVVKSELAFIWNDEGRVVTKPREEVIIIKKEDQLHTKGEQVAINQVNDILNEE